MFFCQTFVWFFSQAHLCHSLELEGVCFVFKRQANLAVTGIVETFLFVPQPFLISYKWLCSIEAECVAPWRLDILKSDVFCAPSLPRSAVFVVPSCMPSPLLSYSFKLKAERIELRLSSVLKYCHAQ